WVRFRRAGAQRWRRRSAEEAMQDKPARGAGFFYGAGSFRVKVRFLFLHQYHDYFSSSDSGETSSFDNFF
ncbi:hypothetical protein, partial [Chromobacterium vaccinii]|uniref:hypothetical protein n=1 Tax=Chromobacterium vaccinii TaxID=1108595 RepID=UPI001F21A068